MKIVIINKSSFHIIVSLIVVLIAGIYIPLLGSGDIEEAATVPMKVLPIYCVETSDNQISVSFDAAWGADNTDKILEILEKHNIRATFFLVANWVEQYPDKVKKIHELGHDIGNHTYSHPRMTKLSDEQKKEELMKTHKLVKDLIGVDMELFRPPYGAFNDSVVNVAKECGYYTIKWDVDSRDWENLTPSNIMKTTVESETLKSGSIILFHNSAKYTPDALDLVFTGLEQKGYKFVPISELILREDYYIDQVGRQKHKIEKEVNK